jgi:hypothetical protein
MRACTCVCIKGLRARVFLFVAVCVSPTQSHYTMHVCMHLQIHTHSYVHGCMLKCIYVRIHQGICRVGACARTCMCASKCKICVCVLVCVCLCVCARLCAKSLCVCVCACLRASACLYECARERVRARARTHAHLCGCIRPSRSAAAPGIGLRVHVGAVREQRRHHIRVPVGSGPMERRVPAAETRSRTHRQRAPVGACKWERARVRSCACLCGVCVYGCVCVHVSAYPAASESVRVRVWNDTNWAVLRAHVCAHPCAAPYTYTDTPIHTSNMRPPIH